MGFFDTRKRLLRQKIIDLQAELDKAGREWNYIVEQGVYFASLPEMSESTQVVMANDLHTSEETEVIRSFFDRNGFTVEILRLDFLGQGFADIEIIPPNEMLTAITVIMQANGFHVIDDSSREDVFNFTSRICPVSALARAVAVLFARRVQKIIPPSPVNMTKEGNRLLSWMPAVIKTLRRKVSDEVINAIEYYFDEAFDHFYSKESTQTGRKSNLELRLNEAGKGVSFNEIPLDRLFDDPPIAPPAKFQPSKITLKSKSSTQSPISLGDDKEEKEIQAPPPIVSSQPVAEESPSPYITPFSPEPASSALSEKEARKLKQSVQLAKALALMYRSLIRVNPAYSARNAANLLEQINRFFTASASCVLIKAPAGDGLVIHAQSGEPLAWGRGSGNENDRPLPTSLIRRCVKERTTVTGSAAEDASNQKSPSLPKGHAAAIPLMVDGEFHGIVYIDRPATQREFGRSEVKILNRLAQVFQEYPDLTMGRK